MKICFETNMELPELREALDHAGMCLKLKGDPDTRHTTGLMKAFTALGRCNLILDTLRLQPNAAHYIEQFQELQLEAQEYVTRYRNEFKLMVAQETPRHAPQVAIAPVSRPEMPRANGNGNGNGNGHGESKKVERPPRTRLDPARVAQIKRLTASFGSPITWATIEQVQTQMPELSTSTVYQIATERTHTDVPWPNKAPVYQRSEE